MAMNQKTVWAVVVVILIALGMGIVFYFMPAAPALQPGLGTSAGTQQPVAAPLTPPAAGTISAITPISITVAAGGGASRTFAITASTTIMSVVAAGVVGKGVADLTVGTSVFVGSSVSDRNTARSITLPPPSPPASATGADAASVSGKVSAVTASSLTLALSDGTTQKIVTTSKTIVLTSVSAGQKGKALSAIKGSQVQGLAPL